MILDNSINKTRASQGRNYKQQTVGGQVQIGTFSVLQVQTWYKIV